MGLGMRDPLDMATSRIVPGQLSEEKNMTGSCGGCAGAVAVIACAIALSSCGETLDPVPTQPRTVVSAEVVEARFSDSTWNYYTAQQTISSEGGYSGFPRPDAFRATTYTVGAYSARTTSGQP